ncbi:MAG: NAD(P)-binding domain-containing protein, partial [Planctomycetota bacterium]
YEEPVHEVSHRDDGSFLVHTDKGFYPGRVCVIAIGILGKPNKPDYMLPGKLKNAIHFDITSVPIRDSEVLVVGGGDSASEYVQFLVQCENRVTLSYRRASFDRMTSLNREALLALEERGRVRILRSTNIEGVVDRQGRPEVRFQESAEAESFDHLVYALGGSTPGNFLRQVGIDFEGNQPKVTEGYETNIPGLFLIGDLAPDSGSIIIAFNTSRSAMQRICEGYLECSSAPGSDGERA